MIYAGVKIDENKLRKTMGMPSGMMITESIAKWYLVLTRRYV